MKGQTLCKKFSLFLIFLVFLQSLSIVCFPKVEATSTLVMTPPYYADGASTGEKYGLATIENYTSVDASNGRGHARIYAVDCIFGGAYGSAVVLMSNYWECTSGGNYRIRFLFTLEGVMRTLAMDPGPVIPLSDSGCGASLEIVTKVWDQSAGSEEIYSDREVFFEEDWVCSILESFVPMGEREDFFGEQYEVYADLPLIDGHTYAWLFLLEMWCWTYAFGLSLGIAEGDIETELNMVIVEPESAIPPYQLDVLANASPNSLFEGEEFTVTANVENTGKNDLHNVLATLNLPAGLSLVSGANPHNLGTIPSGWSLSASWTVRADSPDQYTLSVGAICDEDASDIDYESVEVIPLPTYELDVIARAPSSVIIDHEFRVIGQVENERGGDMHNVVATLDLPSGLSLISGSNPQSLGTLTVGSHKNASWTVRADLEGTWTLSVEGTCDEGATDICYDTIVVNEPPPLSVEITAPNRALNNTSFHIIAYVKNDGDIWAYNVVATLTLPTGLSLIPGVGDPNPFVEEKMYPGEVCRPDWYVKGVEGNYTVMVDVISDEGSEAHAQKDIQVYVPGEEVYVLWNFTAKNAVKGVASGDIDGDGLSDVVAGSYHCIYAIRSNGIELWNYSDLDGWVWAVDIGDLDGDGKAEVVGGDGNGYLYAIKPDGTLLWKRYAGGDYGHGIYDVKIGDFDGDGLGDVVSATKGFGDVYAFRGYNGSLFWRHTHTDAVRTIAVGDINGDGKDDVAVGVLASLSPPNPSVFAYRGYDGLDLWGGPYPAPDRVYGVDIGDLNGDGKGDVVAGCDDYYVYAIDSTGSLLWKTYLPSARTMCVRVGDLDGDGDNDVAVGTQKSNGDNIVALRGSDGWKMWFLAVGDYIKCIDIGDLDDDGINDIAACGSLINNVWAVKSDGKVLWNYTAGDKLTWHSICIDDINGDGTNDVVAGSNDDKIYVLSSKPPDDVGPTAGPVIVRPDPTNTDSVVNATIVDSLSNIVAAEYFVDVIGADGTGTPMNPVDGVFDSKSEIVTAIIDISGLSDGNHTIYIHGKDNAGNWGDFNVFTFTIDRVPPIITIVSPQNITYTKKLIDLNVTANEPIDTWMFSLNGASNFTFTPNAIISANLGTNELVVYANDTAGNMGSQSVAWTNKLSITINCSLSASTIYFGEEVLVTCSLNCPASDGNVTIQYSTNETTWIDLLSSTPLVGILTGNWTPSTSGTFYIRCIWSGNTFYAGSTSSSQTLNVISPADIAVTNVTLSKTVIGQGYSMNITATVENHGDYTENFNVTLYADKNITVIGDEINIGNQTVPSLTSGNSTTVTFTWNTTGVAKGNYTITAKATPVLGETDTLDNALTDGWVFVTIVGDVNGDCVTDGSDVVICIEHIPSYPGHPKWKPEADINCDDVIDASDIVIIIEHVPSYW